MNPSILRAKGSAIERGHEALCRLWVLDTGHTLIFYQRLPQQTPDF
jgi:hypothetical protein